MKVLVSGVVKKATFTLFPRGWSVLFQTAGFENQIFAIPRVQTTTVNAEPKRSPSTQSSNLLLSMQSTNNYYKCRAQTIIIHAEPKSITINAPGVGEGEVR
jgi:hypothetical protein